jgi:membrane protein DedA with SNARE-associated domain
MVQNLVEQFTYVGGFVVLLLASLGVPIPEEAPIIAMAVLSHEGAARWWIALLVCFVGVLSGDVVLYFAGRHWGERLLNWRIVRLVLSPDREEQIKTAYRRHAIKTVLTARHIMGLRAAAFLTAGIAHVPFWRFFLTDAGAALVSVPLGFGLAYFFTDQLEVVLRDVRRTERLLGLIVLVVLLMALGITAWVKRRRITAELADERDDVRAPDTPTARKRAGTAGRAPRPPLL